MDEEQVEANWLIMSPWWLAKYQHDLFRLHTGRCPELMQLGQMVLDAHGLAIPGKALSLWMEDFKHIS